MDGKIRTGLHHGTFINFIIMDFNKIFDEMALDMKQRLCDGDLRFVWSSGIDASREEIRNKMIMACLKKSIKSYEGNREFESRLLAESGVLKLMERGVSQKNITYRVNAFHIKLTNLKYRLYRAGSQLNFCPKFPSARSIYFPFAPEDFAEFLLGFDSAIPAIDERLEDIFVVLRALELEEQKRKMALKIKRSMVDALVKQYLDPLELNVDYSIDEGEDDRVCITVRQTREATLDFTLSQAAEILSDTESIMKAMKVVQEDRRPGPFPFGTYLTI